MAEMSDQVKMLYRDYANNAASWRLERSSAEKQVGYINCAWHPSAWNCSFRYMFVEQR
jgi:hypothetical protein